MGDLNELIKKTQETLQPLIAKPKLAEKLLQKPPFRFLHDIFSALMASTGFAKGLYTDYELDSANVKEKHQKLQFLDKMVYCTGQCHGKEIDVRSAKIVAGLEPENTNIFLTELALAASNTSLDWNGAVQKALAAFPPLPETLAGSGSGGAEAKPPSEDAPAAKEAAPPARDEAKEAEEKAKAEERAARVTKLLGKPPFRFLHDVISEVTRVTGFADGLYAGDELDSNAIKEKQPKIDYLQKILHCVGCQLNVEVEAKPAKIVAGLEPEDTNKFLQLLVLAAKAGNSSAAVQRVLAGDTAPRAPSAEAKSKRPSVAAPPQEEPAAPPAQSKSEAKQQAKAESGPMKAMAVTAQDDDGDLASDAKTAGHDEDPSTKPGTANRTARPTTARRRPPKLKENVKEVRDISPDDEALEAADKGNNHRETMLQNDDTHGKLIRDILKDQNADEEANRKLKEDNDAKGDGGGDSGIRLGKRRKSFKEKIKGGTSTAAEINDLRLSIQKICQATNPVGKCIEYVYEDMEAMARELDVWKKEYEKKCDVLEEEKKKSDEALQPLTAQLVEVEEQIKEQVHKINTLKATIAKNEDKVLKLLRMVVTS
ncbi:hypothetical protein DYB32_002168 [Aphanomyces invadans]|uniref:TRAF3-interacting protein 1 n=1 Tax=Aphanomyces invadans TaxID=157072 RepID=A0A3R6Z303_9STRA|nr:hypothetical protein DYB32_002168 [Aphanomyces invadans]